MVNAPSGLPSIVNNRGMDGKCVEKLTIEIERSDFRR